MTGKVLKRILDQSGMSQYRLYKISGVSRRTIARALDGGNVTARSLQAIAIALGISVSELMGDRPLDDGNRYPALKRKVNLLLKDIDAGDPFLKVLEMLVDRELKGVKK